MKLKQLASAVILATSGVAIAPLATAATYDLSLVPVQDKVFLNFAQSIDNTGTMVVTAQGGYNPPIDLSLLDFEDETFIARFADPEAVEQGIFSSADYQELYAYIVNARGAGNTTFQPIASYRSYKSDTVTADLIPGFDAFNDAINDYWRQNYTSVYDSVGGDYFVGIANAPFFTVDYTNDDGDEFTYIINNAQTQGFVEVNGNATPLPSALADAPIPGYSEPFAINQSLQVVGWASVDVTDDFQEDIDACLDDETRGSQPFDVCLYNLSLNVTTGTYRRAAIWQLDAQGNVLSTTPYGMAFEPDEDEYVTGYVSSARDINDNGIAVGYAHNGEFVLYTLPSAQPRRFTFPQEVATTFVDGVVTEILPREDSLSSYAQGINNDNWVMGTVLEENNGFARQHLFVHNLDSGESIFPQGFFQTAGVRPRAINNNGIVVGEGEYESDVQYDRQVRAFMYDINVGDFIDLNTLLSCEQREQYRLVSAADINDDNEIIANALYLDTQRYIDGEEVLTTAGDTIDANRIVAVKLTPNGTGSVEQCDAAEEQNYERKGATGTLYGLLTLGLFAFLRRLSFR
ncbi:DUF3466 family protein [Alteromonas lipolytica]|uniref:DUF3466 domain-containing protein n=1 Tax=Alteromonas lipolytica TaxID=1856405 RepID=A0A1E8FGX4_9ALTE|nr:DUF3466 family protein [Alteromonas lipolytica]OFI35164.1 hypothetical protein BFC17_16615 [Alteromonas lipolytica]GGF57265.1 hypothetical protein GCM10011338_06890 [Alteromonas lipolytica]